MDRGIGDKYQQETKYYRHNMSGGWLDFNAKPEIYKEYPDSKKIELPIYEPEQGMNFSDVLKARKSIRHFMQEPLDLTHLSYLLWASTGIQRKEMQYDFRTVPSAGALYPIETYLVVNNITRLENYII